MPHSMIKEVTMRTPTPDNRAVDHARRGRFSEGIEQFPDSPDKLRRGRFSTGIEQLPDTPSKHHTGRFSEGIETLPRTSARLHRGSFADRDNTTRSRPRTRRG
jgi:hypothetical protein